MRRLWLSLPRPEPTIDAEAAVAALGHRGPDGNGIFCAPGVLFAHTRLAILILSATAAQPMASADKKCVVVFNGEIYNHQQLRTELLRCGRSFRSRSDTEVIKEG